MTSSLLPSPQVLVRVAPRMLSDVLATALSSHDLEVVINLDDDTTASAEDPRYFDLAVVSDELSDDTVADIVLVLDRSGACTRLRRGGHDEELCGDGQLDSLLALIDDLLI